MGLRLLALACLVGAAFAGPFQRESQCATRCPTSTSEKFNYEPGRKYVYDYQGVNYVKVAGERKQKAHISGEVEIHVKTKCELILKMKNIRLDHKATPEENSDLVTRLEIPLPFAFEDGKIEHVCPSSEENEQSKNIKKGVISTFINSMKNLEQSEEVKEVDSLGTCDTKYSVHLVRKTIIDKEKDLKSCTNRHSAITSLIADEYESPESSIHTLPIFPKEKLTCRQVIENRIIKEIKCKEISSLKPFKFSESIIEFEGQLELVLTAVESAENLRLDAVTSQNSLLYNLLEEKSVEDREHEVQELLRQMCQKNTGTIDISVSKDFIALITSVKTLSYESLQRIYSKLESGRLCSSKKLTDLFLDTLPMAGTDGAVKLMVNLLLENKVTGLKAKLWAASLALVSHPSEEAVAAVVPLIKSQKHSSVLLGVSAMVYRYCSKHNCENSRPVKEIVSALNEVLGRQCSFDNEKEAIAALKAFGNMGQLLHAKGNILACAKDNDKSIRLRLAAIDAFRRVDQKRPEDLLKLYANPREHYEVRMACLSTVLRHADKQQIRTIKSVAERESDEQVSAYTSTLVANMNKTSSPLKRHVRNMLNEIEINTPKVGYWQNSKNIEFSTFSDILNVGGAVETDIIHSPRTKIPRSLYTRFDLDVFDSHMNIFEVGVRAEGLEAAFKKLVGLRESRKQKSSWSFLQSSNEIEDEKIDASFFFRTMNTEIFDLSVNDLTGYGQMVKMADVLNKISEEKSADFSHSFMFVNSKLVIPSVTGRSYSFGLSGSATVGLTASSKIDIVNIMSKPKNCDVHGHFQPSVNVELAATVGIHSNKPRPDVKIVTRLHAESDIQAQFKIKDGHLGLVKVHMPSENVVLTRVSSDIVEIDAYHQEKPIYENMQKKIDYCFNKLEKPLGISVCGKWEVPRPFLSKTFPFVKGVGNVELSIKKTDVGMKGFEMSFEIPKHKSPLMKFKAALDTPGSRINRRFSADLEVQMKSDEERQLSLQLQTPFKPLRASAVGSLITRQDYIECSLDVQCGSRRQYTIRAISPIAISGSQKTYRPSIEVSSPSSSAEPLRMDGIIAVTKGRKDLITFDLKANKPIRKPVTLKGSIVKDGKLEMSRNSEWRLSSDLNIETPFIDVQIRKSAEKQSKQAQTISTSFIVDYQKEHSQKHSLKLKAKLQQSSSKLSSYAQFETTQFPVCNIIMTWNMQGKLRETLKNDITLKYGRDMTNQYINILQSCRLPQSQPGECKVSLKAPRLNLDSDLVVTHEYEKNAKLHTEVDLRYKEDKHLKTKLHLEKLSERPLKLKVKAEIQTPSKRLMYQDEVEEVSPKKYQGNAALEWNLRTEKKAELRYMYQILSDRSNLHHEIETTLRLPNSRSIKNKALLKLSTESLKVETLLSLDRRSEYSLKADLNKQGASYVSLQVPKLEGNMKIVNDEEKKSADLDLKLKMFRRPRHIISSVAVGLGNAKKLEVELNLDADRKPEDKILLSTSFEKQSRNQYLSSLKLQMLDKLTCEVSASGELSLYGKHELSAQANLLKFTPVAILIRHEMRPTKVSTLVRFAKDQRPKAEVSLDAEYDKSNREIEVFTKASLKSLDNSFETKKLNTKLSFSQSGRSTTVKSTLKFELTPRKIYESEMNCDLQPNMILLKAYLDTPHLKFEKQSIGFSFRKSNAVIASSANIEFLNGKSIAVTSETQLSGPVVSSSLLINTPFDIIRNAKMQASLENRPSQKSLTTFVEINGEKKADAELKLTSSSQVTEIKGRMKTVWSPELTTRILIEGNRDLFRYDIKVMKNSLPLMATLVSKQNTHQQLSYSLHSLKQGRSLINLNVSREILPESTRHTLEAEGPFPSMSVSLETAKKDKNSLNVAFRACKSSQNKACYSIKAYHKVLVNEENYRFYKKLTLDVEKSIGNSSPEHIANVNIVASAGEHDYREKFIVETKEKKLGYEFRFHLRENEQDHCSLDSHIFMPHRTIRIRGSALNNQKSALLDFEVIPNVAVPTRKLGFELKKENSNSEISGYVRMLYPGMRNPIELSGRVQKEGKLPISGKLQLNYSPVSGKVLHLEILSEQPRRGQQGKSIIYKLYSEDKTIDITSKLENQLTRDQSVYVFSWTWNTQEGPKNGRMSLKLAEKRNGKPQIVEIEMVTPKVTSKMNSRITWGQNLPTGLTMYIVVNNENIFELEAKAENGCIVYEEKLRSRNFMKTELCVARVEEEKLQLISLKCTCEPSKCLEFEIEIDPEHPQFANINIEWDKNSYRHAIHEIRQVMDELKSRYVSEETIQSIRKIWENVHDTLFEAFADAKGYIQEIVTRRTQTVKLYLKKVRHYTVSVAWERLSHYIPMDAIKSNIIDPIVKVAKCWVNKYMEFVHTHLPEFYRNIWENAKREVVKCMKTYCPRDSFCYEIAEILEHFEMERAKRVVSRRMLIWKRRATKTVQEFEMQDIPRTLKKCLQTVRQQVISICDSFLGPYLEGKFGSMIVEYVTKLERFLYEKVSEDFESFVQWLRQIIRRVERDEDFRVLKSLVKESKEKAVYAWNNKEELLENTWQPLKQTLLKEYPKRLLEDKITVQKYSPKEGTIQIQIHNPVQRKHIESALLAIRRKIGSEQ